MEAESNKRFRVFSFYFYLLILFYFLMTTTEPFARIVTGWLEGKRARAAARHDKMKCCFRLLSLSLLADTIRSL